MAPPLRHLVRSATARPAASDDVTEAQDLLEKTTGAVTARQATTAPAPDPAATMPLPLEGKARVTVPTARIPTTPDRQDDDASPPSGRTWNGHERRSADRVKRLSREFDALCTSAVDAAEITAGLESVGFTDSTAQEYGFADVFTLAESLFQQTPRLVNHRPGRLANPWAERPIKHLTRGISFALPGLVFVSCLPQVTSTQEFIALTVAMLVGWPAGQTMAFLGYALDGRRHPMGARAMLVLGLVTAVGLALAYSIASAAAGVSLRVAALGAGEIVYMAAASVVLVVGSEWVVLASLVPGLATALLAWRGFDPSGRLLVAGAVGTVLASVGAALATTARARLRDLRTAFASLTRHDRRESLFHLTYGVAGGLLVTLPALSLTGMAASSLSLLPVIWSMGWAEWHIVSLRRRSFELLNQAISIEYFRLAVRRLARQSVARYLSVLTLLTVLLIAGIRVVTGTMPNGPVLVSFASSWLLGWGFYVALVLSSLGRMRIVVPCMIAAVAVGLTSIQTLHWQPSILVAPLLLCTMLTVPIQLTIGDPTRHM